MTVVDYDQLNIKVPIGWTELAAISELSRAGIKINCTCGFDEAQAILAANAGAKYFSFFYGRMKDINVEPAEVIKRTRGLLEGTDTEIIMGSIRHMKDLVDSFVAGAHIVTAPLSIFEKMAAHPKTKESVDQFLSEFKQWINQ
jgi:transaldolase